MGITRQEAARRINVSQPAYVRYENGTRIPSIQVINEIAKAFNTSADYLTGKTDKKAPDYIILSRSKSPALCAIVESCNDLDDDKLKRLMAYISILKD